MLNKLQVNDFKSHNSTKIELKNITLLVGTNSSGKSSLIQSLLLVIHNVNNINGSVLNGHLVSIGNFSEARNFVTNARSFSIKIVKDIEELELRFYSTDDKNQNANVEFVKQSEVLSDLLNYSNSHVHYLSAHRIGAQDLYSKNFDNYSTFGLNGEYAIDYLENNKLNLVDKELQFSKESETLENQTNFWLEYILNHRIETNSILGTDKIQAEYVFKNTKKIRPKNIGSGVSYVISIIIICLASKKGDIILLENPEIHLHPKAQSYLTEFFIKVASSGRQLIIETHSDHIFNGLRVGVHNRKINTEDLSINFFVLDQETSLTNHAKIEISSDGGILNGQEYLFDQFSKDLKELVGF